MRCWGAEVLAARRAAVLLACGALVGTAAAQQVALAPSTAQRCLVREGAKGELPEYPLIAYKFAVPGRVKVALRFASPDTPPAVSVLVKEGSDEVIDSFVESVQRYARAYRVPCLRTDETPADLLIDFVFRPDERQVHWSVPEDEGAERRRAMIASLVHESGNKAPPYPYGAAKGGLEGRVLVRLLFEAADKAPVAEILTREQAGAGLSSRRTSRLLAKSLESWVTGYRMPAFQGRPFTTEIIFVYRMEGQAFGFKPGLTLPTLLPMVRDIGKQILDFDFERLACPFDVKLLYLRPLQPNSVAEIGSPDPARRPFLAWLADIELALPEPALDSVFADTAVITVPCMKIKLNPQE